MNDGESVGFGAEAPAGNLIQSFMSDGFVLGSNDRVNRIGTTYHLLALHDDPNQTASGSYVGDATDNRNVSGVGFTPDVIWLKPHSIWTAAQRPDGLAGDRTALFAATPHEANNIQALLPDGFQVGTSNRTNQSGTTVYWTALRSTVKDTADLGVTVSVDDATPYEGDNIRLTIELENLGGGLSTAQVKAGLPSGLTYLGSTATHGTYGVGTGVWTDITVAAGDTATLILDAEVDSGTGGSSIVAGATLTYTSVPDPNPNNDEDDVRIDVTPVSVLFTDIAVTKSVNDPAPFEGDTIRYTITAENTLGGDASGIGIRDVLPGELTFLSATDTRGSYSAVSGMWSIPAMAGNSIDTLWIEASVDSGTVGRTVTNTASLSAVDGIDLNGLNNSDSASLTVVTPVDLAMDIGVDDPTPAEGDTILYVVTITNTGALDATAVDVSTPTPAGLTHVSATTTSGTYNAFSGNWRIPLVAGGTGTPSGSARRWTQAPSATRSRER